MTLVRTPLNDQPYGVPRSEAGKSKDPFTCLGQSDGAIIEKTAQPAARMALGRMQGGQDVTYGLRNHMTFAFIVH